MMQERMQAAADSAIFAVLTRVGIVVLMSLCVPAGAWAAMRIIDQLDSLIHRVDSQHEETVDKLNALDVRQTRVETRLEYVELSARVGAGP